MGCGANKTYLTKQKPKRYFQTTYHAKCFDAFIVFFCLCLVLMVPAPNLHYSSSTTSSAVCCQSISSSQSAFNLAVCPFLHRWVQFQGPVPRAGAMEPGIPIHHQSKKKEKGCFSQQQQERRRGGGGGRPNPHALQPHSD